MPYIKKQDRERLNELTNAILENDIESAGELNYIFTIIAKRYWSRKDRQNYQAINDIVGALDGCKVEFQRRTVANYEMKKIDENGDV